MDKKDPFWSQFIDRLGEVNAISNHYYNSLDRNLNALDRAAHLTEHQEKYELDKGYAGQVAKYAKKKHGVYPLDNVYG